MVSIDSSPLGREHEHHRYPLPGGENALSGEGFVEPVEDNAVEEGAVENLTVVPRTVRGAELDQLLLAGQLLVEGWCPPPEGIVLGVREQGRALDLLVAPLHRVRRHGLQPAREVVTTVDPVTA